MIFVVHVGNVHSDDTLPIFLLLFFKRSAGGLLRLLPGDAAGPVSDLLVAGFIMLHCRSLLGCLAGAGIWTWLDGAAGILFSVAHYRTPSRNLGDDGFVAELEADGFGRLCLCELGVGWGCEPAAHEAGLLPLSLHCGDLCAAADAAVFLGYGGWSQTAVYPQAISGGGPVCWASSTGAAGLFVHSDVIPVECSGDAAMWTLSLARLLLW
ncbi:hypothetical protein Nepgr_028351 [Nepenthes gracilis]|uniref:Uncharacterized protein n=1 Tax=Nepenthes gracilis TaxID=150966 RepID=A0AAD3TAI0_NEPGR|nr:hypothetical protein Nepgr_028351 [Nepenthes gracilis]